MNFIHKITNNRAREAERDTRESVVGECKRRASHERREQRASKPTNGSTAVEAGEILHALSSSLISWTNPKWRDSLHSWASECGVQVEGESEFGLHCNL